MRYGRYGFCRANGWVFKLICAVLIFAVAFLLTDAKLRPAVYDIAALEAKAAAEQLVGKGVEKALSDCEIDYSQIVAVNYSADKKITGITTDIVKMNLFKTEISRAVDRAFEKNGFVRVNVPLGSATGVTLFSGIGPDVKVKVGISGVTVTDFENVFEAAGVNQTQHSVMLNLETTVILNLSGKRITHTVKTSVCVAQTVIVGSVPEVMVAKNN